MVECIPLECVPHPHPHPNLLGFSMQIQVTVSFVKGSKQNYSMFVWKTD